MISSSLDAGVAEPARRGRRAGRAPPTPRTSSGVAVALGVALVVAVPAVGRRLDDDGPAARRGRASTTSSIADGGRPRRRCRRPRRSRRRSPAARRSSGAACWVAAGGELGVAVVLAEEDDRQLPHGGEVHRLVERALGHGAVAEERHRDAAVGPQLRRRRRADRDRQAGGHDAVGAEDPEVRVGDVHRAAAAAVGALVLGHQLGEHPERVEALGQAVAVAPVGRGDDVGRAAAASTRPTADASCPIERCTKPGHLAVAVERGHPLLEAADHAASAGASRARSSVRTAIEPMYCTGRYKTGATMTEQIEIPASFPEPRRRPRASGWCSPAPAAASVALLAHAFSQAGAPVALVARTEARPQGGRRRAARARRSCCSGDVDRRGLQRGGRRRHRGRVGRRRRLDLQRRDLADRRRPARDRPVGLARRCSR